jgi:hypothetical protein
MNHGIPRPTIVPSPPSTRPPKTPEGVRKDIDWLKQHHEEYLGQWVALHEGVLLGANPSFVELRRIIKAAGLLNVALFMSLKLERWK